MKVPKELGMDVFLYRKKDEEECVRRLAALDLSLVAS